MSKPKLNQIIAVLNGKKSQSQKEFTELYHLFKKPALFEGLTREYKVTREGEESFPPEKKLPQVTSRQLIDKAKSILSDLWDTVLTCDNANCFAKADIKVDGVVIASSVPVSNLLYLEKQLTDLNTFINSLPVHDPVQRWQFDNSADFYASEPYKTVKTKKVIKTLVKYEATEHHPAQTEVYNEDVKVGEWTQTNFSGGIPAKDKNAMLERISVLRDAVKFAREEANGLEVDKAKIGEKIFNFVLNGNLEAKSK